MKHAKFGLMTATKYLIKAIWRFSSGLVTSTLPLPERMKRYESTTTDFLLDESLPVYVRLDMRAGHSFCRGLDKPFDDDYSFAMREATKYLVDKTGAMLGYTQSDEISLVWQDCTKVPFGNRLFKLESVFASMCTAAFILAAQKTKLKGKVESNPPSFDCRAMNLPSMNEAANMILWRVRDSKKNSITLLSLAHFSNKEIHGKNSDQKIEMLMDRKNVDWNKLPERYRLGTFMKKSLYQKVLTDSDLERIPKKNLPPPSEDGKYRVTRSKVVEFEIGRDVGGIANWPEVIFFGEKPRENLTSDGIGV